MQWELHVLEHRAIWSSRVDVAGRGTALERLSMSAFQVCWSRQSPVAQHVAHLPKNPQFERKADNINVVL